MEEAEADRGNCRIGDASETRQMLKEDKLVQSGWLDHGDLNVGIVYYRPRIGSFGDRKSTRLNSSHWE